MEIKTTMSYHLTTVRMDDIKNTKVDTSASEEIEKREFLNTMMECKLL
jgi:hypothetical protein